MVEGEGEGEIADPVAPERGAPLVLAWWRAALLTVIPALAIPGLARSYLGIVHSERTLESVALPVGGAMLAWGLFVVVMLRGEELRLGRELRTARSGTALIRGMVLRRRERMPGIVRMLSTSIGMAAVLLADGEREAAIVAVGRNSFVMTGGRLAKLREVVEADIDRATGSTPGRERCIAELRAMPRIGNREADLYAAHVLVKAVLELGAEDVVGELLERIAGSQDEEERLYGVWLRVWFDLDESPPLADGELRMAALLARSHGAQALVEKLDTRIARATPSPSAPQKDLQKEEALPPPEGEAN
jgi:hypothetical protein